MYPALAIVDALGESPEVLWVGGEGGMEGDLVGRVGLAFESIPAAGLHGVGWRAFPGNLWRLARGFLAARGIIARFHPDVMLLTGGYVGVPMAAAGRKVPKVAFVPDIEPGFALKVICRLAERICVSVEDSTAHCGAGERVVVTGYPTRPGFHGLTREEGRRGLGLSPDRPVVLVAGGSRGAHSINEALWRILPGLLLRAQVIHLTGAQDWGRIDEIRSTLSEARLDDYHAYPYLHEEMGMALASANLVVSRAGASSLGEYPLFGLPSILVPYPHAWRYQTVNAEYLADRGAAVVLEDERLNARLWETLVDLLDHEEKRQEMSEAASALSRPEAAVAVANQIKLAAGEEAAAP